MDLISTTVCQIFNTSGKRSTSKGGTPVLRALAAVSFLFALLLVARPILAGEVGIAGHCDIDADCITEYCDQATKLCATKGHPQPIGGPCKFNPDCISGYCNQAANKCDTERAWEPNSGAPARWLRSVPVAQVCSTESDCPKGYECSGGRCSYGSHLCATERDCPPNFKCLFGEDKQGYCTPPDAAKGR